MNPGQAVKDNESRLRQSLDTGFYSHGEFLVGPLLPCSFNSGLCGIINLRSSYRLSDNEATLSRSYRARAFSFRVALYLNLSIGDGSRTAFVAVQSFTANF